MRSNQTIKTAVATTFMLAAIAAPAASAQFDLAPAGTPSGRAQSQATTGAPVVQPNLDEQAAWLARAAAAPPILPAPGTPAARAAYQQNSGPQSLAAAKQPPLPRNAKFSLAGLPPASTPTMIVRTTGPGSGFDWGDAGIGAAAGLALSMLALGVVLVVSQRRTRRPGRSAATAS
ncbi:MAG: hypothetical protein JO372_21530 [Solirubrobacterales bacterium]|nr:hypothetical protein [Solirubrobacterales bacterium]